MAELVFQCTNVCLSRDQFESNSRGEFVKNSHVLVLWISQHVAESLCVGNQERLEDWYCVWFTRCPHTYPNCGCPDLNSSYLGATCETYLVRVQKRWLDMLPLHDHHDISLDVSFLLFNENRRLDHLSSISGISKHNITAILMHLLLFA